MKLYDVCAKVTDSDFEVTITNHNVISYAEEKISYYTNYGTSTIFYPKLDEIKTGLLNERFPSIQISTVNEHKVEYYKKVLTEILKNEIRERVLLSQMQLGLIA